MVKLLRLLLSQPLVTLAVFTSVSIVGSLLVSAWADKRRERRVLLQLRYRKATESALTSTLQSQPKPIFRIFRWQFLVVAIALAAMILIRKGSQPEGGSFRVTAKTPPVTAAPEGHSDTIPAGDFAEYSLSLRIDATRTKEGVRETWGAISSSLALDAREDALHGSNLTADPAQSRASETVPFEAAVSDETDLSFLENPGATAASYYPIEPGSRFTIKSISQSRFAQ